MISQKKKRSAVCKKKETKPILPRNQSQIKGVENWRELYGLYNQRMPPLKLIDNLAEKLLLWVESDEPKLFFEEFLLLYHIKHDTFSNFLERSPKLLEAKEYAINVLSVIRERKAYKEHFYPTFRHTQGLYSKKWKQQEQYFANLRKDEDKDNSNKVIILEKYRDEIKNEKKDQGET